MFYHDSLEGSREFNKNFNFFFVFAFLLFSAMNDKQSVADTSDAPTVNV